MSDQLDEAAISRYITETLDGVEVVTAPSGDSFFFYDPDRSLPHDRRLPFATLVTSDAYDQVSNLNRPGIKPERRRQRGDVRRRCQRR